MKRVDRFRPQVANSFIRHDHSGVRGWSKRPDAALASTAVAGELSFNRLLNEVRMSDHAVGMFSFGSRATELFDELHRLCRLVAGGNRS